MDLMETAVHQTDSLDSEADAVLEKSRDSPPWKGDDWIPVKCSHKKKDVSGVWPARVVDFVDTVSKHNTHVQTLLPFPDLY